MKNKNEQNSQINKHLNIENQGEGNSGFVLFYKKMVIGYLTYSNSFWKFEYSFEFKIQNDLEPLIDFPNLDKVYENRELWPFFSYRIPGLSQPNVQEIIKKSKIDSNNKLELLKKFGEKAVFNPFELKYQNSIEKFTNSN